MQKNKTGLKVKNMKKSRVKNGRKNKEKKRKAPQNFKSPTQRQSFITTIKSMTEYTHIHIHP